MSEGTSLEDIEMGNVAHTADSDVMNEILKDMNGLTPEPQAAAPPPPMPPMPPMPRVLPPYNPMMDMQMFQPPQQSQHYEPMQQPQPQQSQQPQHYEPIQQRKKNAWSHIFDRMLDPLFVAILVGILSLPALHTWLAKYVKWAYHVGGALSWTGILLQSILAGAMFAGYQFFASNISAM